MKKRLILFRKNSLHFCALLRPNLRHIFSRKALITTINGGVRFSSPTRMANNHLPRLNLHPVVAKLTLNFRSVILFQRTEQWYSAADLRSS